MDIHNNARARLESGRNPPELAKPGHGLIDVKPGKVMSTGVRLTLLLQHLPVEQATKIKLIIMLIGGPPDQSVAPRVSTIFFASAMTVF